jgi:hypothetical protein
MREVEKGGERGGIEEDTHIVVRGYFHLSHFGNAWIRYSNKLEGVCSAWNS